MSKTVPLTHRGWFGLCPVYFGEMDTPSPLVEARHPLLEPLLYLSECLYGLCFLVATWRDPTFEPAWPLVVTGELKVPRECTVEDEYLS